ncbi:ABC transporter permease [Mesorhizobium sp. LHD-90]|uniref:ABC transporter permease n=1 Tax=Mesorhizobium sp. LHD-90 TaxID=3071414 RepID=UPI0027E10729|nr:ABC transporter permease [Mesorhizobium sp. LHD-90]MDQ6435611.1 ABC transporter permease [Mesorhizobium sp. LHD-90]
MIRTVLARLGLSLTAALGAALFAFLTLRVGPGDPARLVLGAFASDEAVAALRAEMGLDKPYVVQFVHYIADFVTGDWGKSYAMGEPVRSLLADRFPATIELGLCAFVIAVAMALLCGMVGSYARRDWITRLLRTLASFSIGVPQFWFGLILLMVGFECLGLFPGPVGRLGFGVPPPPSVTGLYTVDALLAGDLATFADACRHLLLPAVTLGLLPFGFLLRLFWANLDDVANEPFVLVGRSRGMTRWQVFRRYVVPNAIVPTLTASGLVLGQMLAGSVLVERVFNWPGAGALVTQGILQQDYSVVQTFILLSAVVYIVANLCVDVLVAAIDPRIARKDTAG